MILVIDDEAPMRRLLRVALTSNHYRFLEAETGYEGLAQATTKNPDLIMLDLGLPDLDGVVVTERLREWASTPIIVVSARGGEQDQVRALDAGANDFVTKPFHMGELMARVRVALRSWQGTGRAAACFAVGELTIDFARRRIVMRGKDVHLTPTEFRLLTVLVKDAGRVVTHSQLLREVWGPTAADQTQYLRVYVAQLRHKLERDSTRPEYVLTEPGVGYRFRFDD